MTVDDSQPAPAVLPVWRQAPILSGYAVAVLVGGLIHLLLGAEVSVVALVTAAALISTIPAFLFGVRDMAALVTLSLGGRYATSAIAWKLLVMEPVDRGLYDPETSFLVIFCGVAAATCAALLVHFLLRGRTLLREHYAVPGVQMLLGVAVAETLLALSVQGKDVAVLGGIGALAATGSTLLPIAWMAFNQARGRPVLSPAFLTFVAGLSILELGANSRQLVLQPAIGLTCYLVCMRIRVSRSLVIFASIAAVLFIAVVSPIMLSVRSARNYMSMGQVMSLTIDSLRSGDALQRARLLSLLSNKGTAYYLDYTTGGGEFVDRLVKVEQLDIMVDRAHRFGPIGSWRFWQGLTEVLPSALVPDKTVAKTPSYAFWVYGLIPWGMEFNATPTTFGDAYAIGGLEFVVFSMFFAFGSIFVFFRLFCPRFENSLFAAFIFGAYIQEMTELSVLGLCMFQIREFPILLIIFWLANRIREPFFALTSPPANPA